MDPRLVQLTRILNSSLDSASVAREAVSARPDDVADALVLEASASDDVMSAESAVDYLDGRLSYLGDIVDPAAAERIRARFRERIGNW